VAREGPRWAARLRELAVALLLEVAARVLGREEMCFSALLRHVW